MSVKVAVLIPARLGSSRLKRKPLSDIAGRTLVRRVYERAGKLRNASEVAVAVDSEEVRREVESFGGRAVMTPPQLASGSERVFYAAEKAYGGFDIIVNLQGDEPFIDAGFVDSLIENSSCSAQGLVSGYTEIEKKEALDSSVVKVVLDSCNFALYFSRSPIPHGARRYKKHLGVYVWRRKMLEDFCRGKKSSLEKTEKLEQLRVLETGGRIKMLQCEKDSPGIDTPEGLEKARQYVLKEQLNDR